MRSISSASGYAVLLLVTAACFTSCRTKDKPGSTEPVTDNGSLIIHITNRAGGKVITNGAFSYTNLSGNTYNVTLFKYLVSNFTLIKNDNSERKFANYKLINGLDSTTWDFTLSGVSNGTYKAVRFYLGVDSAHNHSLANVGDLDPSNGMAWDWNTGYIFFKHEGSFHNDTGGNHDLLYHFGTDKGLTTVDIPAGEFEIKGNTKILYLNFDLNNLYAAPIAIDFTNNNAHQSLETNDKIWLGNMKTNFPHAFTFVKVQ